MLVTLSRPVPQSSCPGERIKLPTHRQPHPSPPPPSYQATRHRRGQDRCQGRDEVTSSRSGPPRCGIVAVGDCPETPPRRARNARGHPGTRYTRHFSPRRGSQPAKPAGRAPLNRGPGPAPRPVPAGCPCTAARAWERALCVATGMSADRKVLLCERCSRGGRGKRNGRCQHSSGRGQATIPADDAAVGPRCREGTDYDHLGSREDT
jgi:hypothetical protein